MSCLVEVAAYRARYLYPKGVEPVDAYLLFREFYRQLGTPLRAVVEFKVRKMGKRPSDFLERPWLFLRYMEEALGSHNAELLASLFADFARKNGVPPNVATEALRSEEGWKKLAQLLRNNGVG